MQVRAATASIAPASYMGTQARKVPRTMVACTAQVSTLDVQPEGIMIEWARIEAILGVLDRIRPILQADGVNVELIDVQDNITRVRLTGLCARCACAPLMLQAGLEEALRQEIHDFGELQLICE